MPPGVRAQRLLMRSVMILGMLMNCFIEAEAAASKGRKNRKKRKGGDLATSFWLVIKVTYLAVFLPLLLWFVFSIVRDPLSGKVAKELWRLGKKRCISFLGRSRGVAARRRAAAARAD